MGRFRTIKRNCGASIPWRIVTVDCEAYIDPPDREHKLERQRFRLACATAGRWRKGRLSERQHCNFFNPQAFWGWLDVLTVPRGTTWVFAHNLAYDLTLLDIWREIRTTSLTFSPWSNFLHSTTSSDGEQNSQTPQIVLGDPPTIIGLVNRKGHKIVLVDTLNYWRCPLKVLGESVGLPKGELPDQSASDDDWLQYCRRDVDILTEAVTDLLRWWQDNDYGNWAYTAPALAMHAYRHRFMPCQIAAHDVQEIRLLERASYYGGRLEAYWIGPINGPCYLLDVNSLYPSVMARQQFPAILWDHEHVDTFTCDGPNLPTNQLCAEVVISTDQPHYPLRTNRGVIYPVGVFQTVLCGPELEIARQRQHILAWGSWAHYSMRGLFAEYVRHFWALKQSAESVNDTATALFAKTMLNSLAGKFAQRGGRWKYDPAAPILYDFGEFINIDKAAGTRQKCLALHDRTFVQQSPVELPKSCPIISAWIASAARAFMLGAMQTAGMDHIYYVSTDALIVDQIGMTRLENCNWTSESELGKFRYKAVGLSGHIGGLHQYRVGDRVVFGGVPHGITPDQYGSWEHCEFPGLCDIIAQGGPGEVRITRYMKQLTAAYERRKPKKDCATEPWDAKELPATFTVRGFRDLLVERGSLLGLIG